MEIKNEFIVTMFKVLESPSSVLHVCFVEYTSTAYQGPGNLLEMNYQARLGVRLTESWTCSTNFTIRSVVNALSFILSLGLAKQCTEVRIHFLNFLYTRANDILRQTSILPYRKGSGKKDDLEKHM